MNVIVFGGSGFVGSHVADALSEAGHEVTVADLVESPYLRPDQIFVRCDITESEQVLEAISGNEVVYDFAGLADIHECRERPLQTATVNVVGTVSLLEGARAAKAARFVFASSIYVAGNSGSFYRVSKQASELYIREYQREYGLVYTILRFGTLYGRRAGEGNSVHRYLEQALVDRRILAQGTGEELREYIHVADAAQLCVRILDSEFENEEVVLTGHHPLRFRELLALIAEIVGGDVQVDVVDSSDGREGSEFYEGHYAITPYAFRPKLTRKLVSNSYVDLGQGLIDVLHEIDEQRADQAS